MTTIWTNLGRPMLGALLALTLTLGAPAQERPKAGSEAWRAEKRDQVLAVVADLQGRRRDDLDPALRRSRKALLEALADYARQGDFPINERYPDRLVPYFIDDGGRRCALAHLIETSGETALLNRLAREANNAYLAQIGDDEELDSWLRRHGLDADEVAYIQAPSIIDRPPTPPGDPGGYTPPIDGGRGGSTPPTGGGRTGGSPPDGGSPTGGGRGGENPGPPRATPPAQGPTSPPRVGNPAGGVPGVSVGLGRKKASSPSLDFGRWWQLQRDLHVDVRARYHGAAGRGLTGNADQPEAGGEALRPGDADREAIRRGLEALRADPAFEAAVLMALSEAGGDEQARTALASELRAALGRKNARHRGFSLLALGRSGAPAAVPDLVAVLGDQPEGRKLLGESSRVPADLRAMAALALGQTADAAAARALLQALDDESAGLDGRCAAVLGLASLGRERIATEEILPRLGALAEDESVPAVLRQQALAALGAIGDRGAVALALDPLKRFRGSVETRRAAARTLANLGRGLERELFDVLAASARRDTDAGTRQLAIAAIGEISAHDRDLGAAETEARRELIDEVGRFLSDGVTGFFKQKSDRPFYAVAAGLHASTHPGHRAALVTELTALMTEGKRVEDRAAAALGLGLSGSAAARPALRALLAEKEAPMVAGYAAEALGLLADGESVATLLALALESHDEFVAYEATVALAATGRVEVQPALIAALGAARSESRRAALVRALGLMGDRRSIGALLEIAGDGGRNLELRQRAVSALGLILRESGRPWSLTWRLGLDPSSSQPSALLAAGIL
ncbi:MAG: HEAT repeat domain-containing protein [Planctomycetes bacterium]|nr:HEAT repeat domain-containing protein [Planctomycetota bacterium]